MKLFHAKRKAVRNLILGIITAILVISAIYIGISFTKDDLDYSLAEISEGLTQYGISVIFSPEEKVAYCKQYTNYVNDTNEELSEIYFHLYPNAFRYEDKPVFPPEELERAYPNGFSPGEIRFEHISINDEPADFIIEGFSDNILKIMLEEPLKPDDRIRIDMEYSVLLPNSPGRFGYGENTFNFANWYPIVCVYDDGQWHLDPYYAIGDPFYSNIANYKVEITAPKDYIIAATGEIAEEIRREGSNKIWNINAEAVRDFAWVASNKFKVSEKKVGSTRVYSYYYTPEGGEEALDYAASSLEIFNKLFGKYPYPQLSVVQADFFIGGMEYPNLVMIDGSLYSEENRDWLELITVHEVAHQWWYGLVGNNQIEKPWLDEALTEYSTVLYYGQRYGPEEEQEKYEEIIAKGKYQILGILAADFDIDETIDRPVYEFDNWVIYDLLVYGKGAMMFHELRQEMGDKMFFDTLREYFKSNRFKNAKPEDLMAACLKVTGKSWDEFFNIWLYD